MDIQYRDRAATDAERKAHGNFDGLWIVRAQTAGNSGPYWDVWSGDAQGWTDFADCRVLKSAPIDDGGNAVVWPDVPSNAALLEGVLRVIDGYNFASATNMKDALRRVFDEH